MNFIQFATNNVKRNTKSYLGYFFSILISSTLLFSFRMFINHPDLDTSLFPNYIIVAMNSANNGYTQQPCIQLAEFRQIKYSGSCNDPLFM